MIFAGLVTFYSVTINRDTLLYTLLTLAITDNIIMVDIIDLTIDSHNAGCDDSDAYSVVSLGMNPEDSSVSELPEFVGKCIF